MFSSNWYKSLSLSFIVFFLFFIFLSYQHLQGQVHSPEQGAENEHQDESFRFLVREERVMFGNPVLPNDPTLALLGKSFAEIRVILGEPDQQGYSSWQGPHNFMLYNDADDVEGAIYFASPKGFDYKLAVSIILGEGQEVLGAQVGMTFVDIEDILGPPAFGPGPGMGDLYYLDYHFGQRANQVPEVFISFSADDIDSPTFDAFIKWEAFEFMDI